jgi:hypothetical protein
MLDSQAMIQKHRAKGALFDSNLLVLFLVGAVNRQRISKFKRTQNFTVEDFDLLTRLIDWFGKLIATPHVLSQASDLADLRDKEFLAVRRQFRLIVEQLEESYDPSRELVADPIFERLGLADAAIAKVCSRGVLVVTADLDLQVAVQRRGADALNFNHVRHLAWN